MRTTCPACGGLGTVVLVGFNGVPISTPCVVCLGLNILPAEVDDHLAEPVSEGTAA